jgi:predicted TIM-barrel fold metal-dependent hydrolase
MDPFATTQQAIAEKHFLRRTAMAKPHKDEPFSEFLMKARAAGVRHNPECELQRLHRLTQQSRIDRRSSKCRVEYLAPYNLLEPGTPMRRRDLLKSAATLAAGLTAMPLLQAIGTSTPVIDAHIHLFDPSRPGGVPWPERTDTVLYRPALPDRYELLSQSHGVVGAIAVECSPWLVDNFWLQDVVERNSMMLGFIGDLKPEDAEFATALDRLHRSPLFLGIRYGNLWHRDLGAALQKPEFVFGLQLLSQAGLVLETANPDPALIAAVLLVSDHVPNLRIVIDHLPHADPPSDVTARPNYEANLHELSRRPTIFAKGSEIVRRTSGQVNLDAGFYKAQLDQLWDLFGEDRILFGSDWPNSDTLSTFDEVFSVPKHFIETRSHSAQQKYFWKNSIAAYKWRPRTPAQTHLREF